MDVCADVSGLMFQFVNRIFRGTFNVKSGPTSKSQHQNKISETNEEAQIYKPIDLDVPRFDLID